jgi:hypothetical protein
MKEKAEIEGGSIVQRVDRLNSNNHPNRHNKIPFNLHCNKVKFKEFKLTTMVNLQWEPGLKLQKRCIAFQRITWRLKFVNLELMVSQNHLALSLPSSFRS